MDARARFERFARLTDLPLAFLALLFVPTLLVEERSTAGWLHDAAIAVNWIVWLAFCAEYVGKMILAPSRKGYAKSAWFDLLIIVLSPPFLVPDALQSLRAVRILRLLRVVRAIAVAAIGLRQAAEALRTKRFHFVALATAVIVCVASLGILVEERGHNPNIQSFGDALWWAIVTTTTVGYGDVSPTTGEGRLIAVGLMLVGIGFIGVFTATITSFLLEPSPTTDSNAAIDERLARIEAKLDAIARDRRG